MKLQQRRRQLVLYPYFIRGPLLALVLAAGLLPAGVAFADEKPATPPSVAPAWKAGIARAVITPEKGVWLAGYGSKRSPDGKLHDLWMKALALEDPSGRRAVLITSDFQGVPKVMSDRVFEQLEKRFKLSRAQVMLTFSHNHCGPRLGDDLIDYYPVEAEQEALVEEYTSLMVAKCVALVGEALANLSGAHLRTGQGKATFAVNRRNNREADVPTLLAQGTPLVGPVDHSVPVMTVTRPDGKLAAVLFGYACHPTTLSFLTWCGDYPGFAQLEIEQQHPGATAMFVNTCGGDQNPLPRRTVELCQRYGHMLATAVEETLKEPLKPVSSGLKTAFELVDLPYLHVVSREELTGLLQDSNAIRARWAARLLKKLDAGEKFEAAYPYPIHAWRLGQEVLMIGMGAETVVDYALRFKREFGEGTWVCGYADDMISYIPSRRVWEEGGYEGGSNLFEYGRPAFRWAGDIEDRIAASVHKLVKQVRHVGARKHLMVDDQIVAQESNVIRKLGSVTKAHGGRPIFTEGWFYGTVLHDEGRFKLWYRKPGMQGFGYAESSDGLSFARKADLTGINFAGDYTLAVEIDAHQPDPAHKFLAGYDAPGMAAGVAHSADGITWTPYNGGKPVTGRAADSYNQVLWDPLAETYRLFTRTDFGTPGGSGEIRGTRSMTNPDLRANPAQWKLAGEWIFDKKGAQEAQRRQIYAVSCWIYEGVYFGLLSVYDFPGDVSEGTTTDKVRRHERDVMNFYLATSRDGASWNLHWVYTDQPFVPRGADHAFDKDLLLPASTIVTHADKHWIYYAGANERHGSEKVKFDRQHAIGLATLPIDRFVSLTAGSQPGSVITKPLVLTGEALTINADASGGELAVELLDEAGHPLAGFSGDRTAKLSGRDELRWQPHWNPKAGLPSLKGALVRLKFTLRDASLYAYAFEE
jgi:neutral ceramidase